LVVQIPESLASSLETFTFDGSSAELQADGITAAQLVLDSEWAA
jgi:hypothetical protein